MECVAAAVSQGSSYITRYGYDEYLRYHPEEGEEEEEDSDESTPIELGEVDTSIAMVNEVNALGLNKSDRDELVDFMFHCRQKHYLSRFSYGGYKGHNEGGLAAIEDPDNDSIIRTFGFQVVEKYNDLLTKYGKAESFKLKFLHMIKAIARYGYGMCYLTFTAQDQVTGAVSTYHAAVLGNDVPYVFGAAECQRSCILGLLKREDDDKPLAIISVKGGEKDYADLMRYMEKILQPEVPECGLM